VSATAVVVVGGVCSLVFFYFIFNNFTIPAPTPSGQRGRTTATITGSAVFGLAADHAFFWKFSARSCGIDALIAFISRRFEFKALMRPSVLARYLHLQCTNALWTKKADGGRVMGNN